MADVLLRVEEGTRAPYITAQQLGLIAMDDENGTTQATGEANSALLNTYFATGWRTQGKMLVLDAKGYGIWDTVVIPRIEGLSIVGAGVGDTRAEVEYTSYGGACSRIVNLQPALDLMIDYSGMGLYIRGKGEIDKASLRYDRLSDTMVSSTVRALESVAAAINSSTEANRQGSDCVNNNTAALKAIAEVLEDHEHKHGTAATPPIAKDGI